MKKIIIGMLLTTLCYNGFAQFGNILKPLIQTNSNNNSNNSNNNSSKSFNDSFEQKRKEGEKEEVKNELINMNNYANDLIANYKSYLGKGQILPYGYSLEYKLYKETIAKYSQMKLNDPEVQRNINNLESFFNYFLPEIYADEYLNYLKTKKLSDSFDEAYWKDRPDWGIQYIKSYLEDKEIGRFYSLSKTKDWIDNIKAQLLAQQEKIKTFYTSGEYDKHFDNSTAAAANKIFPHAPVLNDPQVENTVRKNHDADLGEIKRIVISSDWYIVKNSFDLPIEKAVGIEVMTNFEGKCYFTFGNVYKQYEGGGIYGTALYLRYNGTQQMNCDNINKSK